MKVLFHNLKHNDLATWLKRFGFYTTHWFGFTVGNYYIGIIKFQKKKGSSGTLKVKVPFNYMK